MSALLADTLQGPSVDWFALSPLLVLLGGALVLLLVAALTPPWPKRWYAIFAAQCAIGAGVLSVLLWHQIDKEGSSTLVGGALVLDKPAVWIAITICVAIFLCALVTDDYLRREGIDGPELYALYLLAALGGIVMAAANDLIVLFLGLEILSIALYVMAASHRKRAEIDRRIAAGEYGTRSGLQRDAEHPAGASRHHGVVRLQRRDGTGRA